MTPCCCFLTGLLTILAALGTAAFILHLVRYDQLSRDIEMNRALFNALNETTGADETDDLIANLTQSLADQKAILMQKCIDIVELQTLTNQTGDGFSVDLINGVQIPAGPSTPIAWARELWDDADFWDISSPTEIRLPGSGRYAFGFNCIEQSGFTGGPLPLTLRLDGSGNFADLCTFHFTEFAIVGYCEVELSVLTTNYVTLDTPAFAEIDPGKVCRLTGRLLGPLTGTGISQTF